MVEQNLALNTVFQKIWVVCNRVLFCMLSLLEQFNKNTVFNIFLKKNKVLFLNQKNIFSIFYNHYYYCYALSLKKIYPNSLFFIHFNKSFNFNYFPFVRTCLNIFLKVFMHRLNYIKAKIKILSAFFTVKSLMLSNNYKSVQAISVFLFILKYSNIFFSRFFLQNFFYLLLSLLQKYTIIFSSYKNLFIYFKSLLLNCFFYRTIFFLSFKDLSVKLQFLAYFSVGFSFIFNNINNMFNHYFLLFSNNTKIFLQFFSVKKFIFMVFSSRIHKLFFNFLTLNVLKYILHVFRSFFSNIIELSSLFLIFFEKINTTTLALNIQNNLLNNLLSYFYTALSDNKELAVRFFSEYSNKNLVSSFFKFYKPFNKFIYLVNFSFFYSKFFFTYSSFILSRNIIKDNKIAFYKNSNFIKADYSSKNYPTIISDTKKKNLYLKPFFMCDLSQHNNIDLNPTVFNFKNIESIHFFNSFFFNNFTSFSFFLKPEFAQLYTNYLFNFTSYKFIGLVQKKGFRLKSFNVIFSFLSSIQLYLLNN